MKEPEVRRGDPRSRLVAPDDDAADGAVALVAPKSASPFPGAAA
jgi:hypothetical protein